MCFKAAFRDSLRLRRWFAFGRGMDRARVSRHRRLQLVHALAKVNRCGTVAVHPELHADLAKVGISEGHGMQLLLSAGIVEIELRQDQQRSATPLRALSASSEQVVNDGFGVVPLAFVTRFSLRLPKPDEPEPNR